MFYMFKVCLEFSRTFFFGGVGSGKWEDVSQKNPQATWRIPPVAGWWFPFFFMFTPIWKKTSTLTLTDLFLDQKRVTRTLHGKPALIWSSPVTSMNRRRRRRVEGLAPCFFSLHFLVFNGRKKWKDWKGTLLETNISLPKSLLKMIFLFQRWHMLVP